MMLPISRESRAPSECVLAQQRKSLLFLVNFCLTVFLTYEMRLQWQPFLIAACVAVLYDILDPDTDPDYGKDIFGYVNQAIYCLDQVEHVGPTTGKALSVDVVKYAKDALNAPGEEIHCVRDLFNDFP